MMNKAAPLRAYLEASLPAWLLLAVLLWQAGGQGDLGLLGLLAFVFPGLWAALRLRPWAGSAWRRLGLSLAFAALLVAGQMVVSYSVALEARSTGPAEAGGTDTAPLEAFGLFFATSGLPFLALRGFGAMTELARRVGWRRLLRRTASVSLVAVLVLGLTAGALYWVLSGPYTGHDTGAGLRVASAVPVLSEGAPWETDDPLLEVVMDGDNGVVRWNPADESGAGVFSLTRALAPGTLTAGDALRLELRSGAELYLAVRLAAADGSAYEAEANLLPGEAQATLVGPFLPALDAPESAGGLAWSEVETITLIAYPPATQTEPAELRVGGLEVVTLEPQPPWLEARNPHFLVRYHAGDEAAAHDVQAALEDRYPSITPVVGFAPTGPVIVTLAADHAELERLQGRRLSGWMVGGTLRGSVALLSPRRYSPIYNGKRYAELGAVATHEVVHLLSNQAVGYRGMFALPVWLHEGLAVYLAGQDAGEAAALQRAAANGQLPSLGDLASEAGFRQQARWAYPMAGSVAHFLAQTYGPERIARLLAAVGQGASGEAALEAVYGLGSDAIEAEWRQALSAGLLG